MKIFTFGDFRLETESRKLFRLTGETVPLTPRVFNLLLALIENRERVLTKEELLETVWADCLVEESNLSQSIFVLRKALGDSPPNPRFIRTIPAQGYRFIAETTVFEKPGADDFAPNGDGAPSPHVRLAETTPVSPTAESTRAETASAFRRRLRPVSTVVLVILCLAFVSFTVSALNDFFSLIDEPQEAVQTVQFFTPESKPEGEVRDISFSPDGKFIVFLVLNDGTGKIFVRAAAGGGLVALTDGRTEVSSPVWSPDGLRIAFLSGGDGGKTGIRTVSYLGGNALFQTALAPTESARARLVKWSGDEKRIFFESAGRLKTVELESGRIDEITSTSSADAGNFKLSPDEKLLVFTTLENGKEQIWAQPLNGGGALKLTDGKYRNLSPDWFPDSRRVAFSSNRGGDFQIYVAAVSGKSLHQLTFNRQHSYFPVVAPDGTQIFYKLAANFDNN